MTGGSFLNLSFKGRLGMQNWRDSRGGPVPLSIWANWSKTLLEAHTTEVKTRWKIQPYVETSTILATTNPRIYLCKSTIMYFSYATRRQDDRSAPRVKYLSGDFHWDRTTPYADLLVSIIRSFILVNPFRKCPSALQLSLRLRFHTVPHRR